MEFSFKKLAVAVANVFSGNPEMKAQQTEIAEAMKADSLEASTQFELLSVKVTDLTAQVETLFKEKTDLTAQLGTKDTEMIAFKADAEKYLAIKEEYDTLKAFEVNRQNDLNPIGEDGGSKGAARLSPAAQAKKDEIERLKAEYPDLVKGLL